MTDRPKLTRRGFVAAGGASLAALAAADAAGAQAAVNRARPRRAARAPLLTPEEMRALDAVTARILPSEPGSPGAREIGVMAYAERRLAGRQKGQLAALRAGLAELHRVVAERHNAAPSFAVLNARQQDAILRDFEAADPAKVKGAAMKTRVGHRAALWGIAYDFVLGGAFGHPRHGGNRNRAGWRLLGFADSHSWAPPFGEIDRA